MKHTMEAANCVAPRTMGSMELGVQLSSLASEALVGSVL
jgi:hypothetical protein